MSPLVAAAAVVVAATAAVVVAATAAVVVAAAAAVQSPGERDPLSPFSSDTRA